MGERAFALLAEFLDQAAVKFHESLKVTLEKASVDFTTLDCTWVLRAAESSFGFLLRCSPELAVSFDPRAQTLRVALAMDAPAVFEMVEVQVAWRLRGALMSALLDAHVGSDEAGTHELDAIGKEAADALEKTQE